MLSRTIKTLKDSNCFDRIIVSSDHPEIQRIAIESGAETPFSRSDELSKNSTPTVDVISDAIDIMNLNDDDEICCVYATNPFLRADAIQLGSRIMHTNREFNYITTVTTFPFPIQRALLVAESGLMEMAIPNFMMTHSQDLPERFHECAQFWWAKAKTWREKRGMQTKVIGIKLPRWMVQDIDTLEDWQTAEIKFELMQKNPLYASYEVTEDNIVNLD
jgi:N-acylneuraminate cytidylyltransferase